MDIAQIIALIYGLLEVLIDVYAFYRLFSAKYKFTFSSIVSIILNIIFFTNLMIYSFLSSQLFILIIIIASFSSIVSICCIYNDLWQVSRLSNFKDFSILFTQCKSYKPKIGLNVTVTQLVPAKNNYEFHGSNGSQLEINMPLIPNNQERIKYTESQQTTYVPIYYTDFADFTEFPTMPKTMKPYYFTFYYYIALSPSMTQEKEKLVSHYRQFPNTRISFMDGIEDHHENYGIFFPSGFKPPVLLSYLSNKFIGGFTALIFSVLGFSTLFILLYSNCFERVSVNMRKMVYYNDYHLYPIPHFPV